MHLCSCLKNIKIIPQNKDVYYGTIGIVKDVLKAVNLKSCEACGGNGYQVFLREEFFQSLKNTFLLKSYVDEIYRKIRNPKKIRGVDFLLKFHEITHPSKKQEIFKILIEQLQVTENFLEALESLINFMLLSYLIREKCIYILYPNAKFKKPKIEDVEFDGLAINPNEGEIVFLETTFMLDEEGLVNHLKSKIINFLAIRNLIFQECECSLKIKFLYISFREESNLNNWIENKSFKYLNLNPFEVKVLFAPSNLISNEISESFEEALRKFLLDLDNFIISQID